MKPKIKLLLLLLLLKYTVYSAPGPDDKYWYLRWRLKNYFMLVGEGKGNSAPIGIRNIYGGDGINTGDLPNYLGNYIGILSTEYLLCQRTGLGTQETLQELYYAMKAIVRLDECEQNFPWYFQGAVLDGCIARGDYPQNYVSSNLTYYNRNMYQFSKSLPGDPFPVTYNEFNPDPVDADGAGVLSKDHMSSLVMALAMVKRCIPADAKFMEMNFHTEAANIVDRLISYLQHKCNWGHLRTPIGTDVSDNWGGDYTHSILYPLAKACEFINPSAHYTDWLPADAKTQWNALGEICLTIPSRNAWIYLNFAAAANDFGNNVVTPQRIFDLSLKFGWDGFYPYIWAIINNQTLFLPSSVNKAAERDMANMPFSGHYNLGSSNLSAEWANSHRYHDIPSENTEGEKDENGNMKFTGKYSAIEYLFLYNLYSVYNNLNYSPSRCSNMTYSNNSELFLNSAIYNHHYGVDLTYQTAVTIPGGEHLKALANNTVYLKPGFKATTGSTFIARINPLGCGFQSLPSVIGFCTPGVPSGKITVDAVPYATEYSWIYPTGWSGPAVTTGPSVEIQFNGNVKSEYIYCYPNVPGKIYDKKIAVYNGPPPEPFYTMKVNGANTWYTFTYAPGVTALEKSSDNVNWVSFSGTIMVNTSNPPQTFYVRAKNPCGAGPSRKFTFQAEPCPGCPAKKEEMVEDESIKHEVQASVYPNPAKNRLSVALFTPETTNCLIKLYDLVGKEVMSISHPLGGDQIAELNLADLQNGIYIVSINDGKQIHKERLVIQR